MELARTLCASDSPMNKSQVARVLGIARSSLYVQPKRPHLDKALVVRIEALVQQKQCVIFETIGIADAFLELLTSLKKKYTVFLIQVRVSSHVALERVSSRDQTHQIQLEKEVIAHMNEQSLQMKLEYDLILENEQATDAQLIQQLNTIWTPSR